MLHTRVGTEKDLRFILQQQRLESNSLGFVPARRLEWELSRGRIWVAVDGREKLGYVYLGSTRSGVLPLFQCCVERGVRRCEIGSMLVSQVVSVAVDAGCSGVKLRCRDDLEARFFWPQLEFSQTAKLRGGNGRSRAILEFTRLRTVW